MDRSKIGGSEGKGARGWSLEPSEVRQLSPEEKCEYWIIRSFLFVAKTCIGVGSVVAVVAMVGGVSWVVGMRTEKPTIILIDELGVGHEIVGTVEASVSASQEGDVTNVLLEQVKKKAAEIGGQCIMNLQTYKQQVDPDSQLVVTATVVRIKDELGPSPLRGNE